MKKGKILLFIMAIGLLLTSCGNRNNKTPETGTSEPVESGTEGSNMAGNNGEVASPGEGTIVDENGWSQEMAAIKLAVVDTLGEKYWPNTRVSPEVLDGTFGITEDMYDDYLGEMPMISTNVDTLIIVKAKEGKVKDVEDALNAYRDRLVNDSLQYPMNRGKIQASRIEVIGNYACFVQLGADIVSAADVGEEEVIEQCREQNELAIEVISSAITQF